MKTLFKQLFPFKQQDLMIPYPSISYKKRSEWLDFSLKSSNFAADILETNDMANIKFPLKEWEETINNMSYEELQRSLEDPSYHESFKELVKNRLSELEVDASRVLEVFIKALKKRRCKYELRDNGKINFTYHRKIFHAELDCEDDFVCIYFIHDIYIDKEDKNRLIRLGKAVNETNKICNVNTFYEDDRVINSSETPNYYFVVSTTALHFVYQNPNFGMELGMVLEDFLDAQYLVKGFMKRKYNRRKKLDDN